MPINTFQNKMKMRRMGIPSSKKQILYTDENF